jgi:hypothetical protein
VKRLAVITVGLALGCSGTKSSDAPRGSDTLPRAGAIDAPSGGSMTAPDLDANSQALEPRDALVAWLTRNGGQRDVGSAPVLKLPVVITMDADRLGITGARLGADGGIALKLDDTALGIALVDRVRQKCKGDTPSCRVWLEGRWRALDGDVGQVQVTRFAGLIAADDAGDRVEILPQ